MSSPANARKRTQLIAIGVLALVLVGVVILISQLGSDDDSGGSASSAAEVQQLFDGIPQTGTVLGDPDAKYTLTEWADLQCPFCRDFAVDVLPTVVDDYVRSGEVKIDFQPLTFIGPQSEDAARMALAVGEQNELWQFVDLFYANQGTENSGYADEAFLSEIAGSINGVDVDQALAARQSDSVTKQLGAAASSAQQAGVDSTPSFALAGPGSQGKLLQLRSLDVGEFTAALDGAIAQQK